MNHRRKSVLTVVGRILEIWRYPVSSLGGEQLSFADVSTAGVADDRRFGLIDPISGMPAAPEKHARWRDALHLQARSVAGHLPDIVFPDGQCCSVSDPLLNARLSDYFGFPVAIAAHQPIDGYSHFPHAPYRHEHFAIHVLTTSSLTRLAELRQVDTVDVRRFRPTVLIDTNDTSGFVEKTWIGKELHLGAVALHAKEETTRCGMTFISQPGVEDDPEILRTILRNNKRHLGINCSVAIGGRLRVGDSLRVGDACFVSEKR